MSEMEFPCPHCGEHIELTEALAAPLIEAERAKVDKLVQQRLRDERQAIADKAAAETREELEARLRDQQLEMEKQNEKLIRAQQLERDARKAKADAEAAIREQDLRVAREVDAAKAAVAKAAAEAARKEAEKDLAALRERAAKAEARQQEAEQAEVAARKAKQEADDAKRRVELEVTRRLDEERAKVRDAVIEEREREHRLKLAEKEQQLEGMRKQIDELRRTGSSGSQQLAGDVQELELFDILQAAFPNDRLERVTKGRSGGDVLQSVLTASGAVAGTILWESKRTKAWQPAWLGKLREDQRDAGAGIAVIASEALPDGVTTFGLQDGVWVTGWLAVVPVATSLRVGLLDAARAKLALAAADTTKDSAYTYLTSTGFQQRVHRVVEAYADMRADLDKEKRSMTRQWGARERQLERMLGGIAGLYGDLRGIFGQSLPEVEQLALPGVGPAGPKLVDVGAAEVTAPEPEAEDA